MGIISWFKSWRMKYWTVVAIEYDGLMTFNTREYSLGDIGTCYDVACGIFPNGKTTYWLLEEASNKEDANFNAFNRIMEYKKTKEYLEKAGMVTTVAGEHLDNGDMVHFDEYGRTYRVTHGEANNDNT